MMLKDQKQIKKLFDGSYTQRSQEKELQDVNVKDYNLTISEGEATIITQNIFNAMNRIGTDEDAILRDLLPRNVATQLLRALLENGASEMGAKMTAMDNATRNAGDLIDSLTVTYNRSRQAVITKELIEIISGADAL